jgi:hypothetical protein
MVFDERDDLKLDALDHPKTFDLAARLEVELPTAIGHLELLWAFTGKQSPQGNIGKWPNGAIARACVWNSDPEKFITALLDSGFIDSHQTYRLLIHDWPEHAPRWVKSKLKTLGLSFLSDNDPSEGAEPDSSTPNAITDDAQGDAVTDTSNDVSRDVSNDTKGSVVKRRQVKGSEELPPWVDREVWNEWEQHRREKRNPLTPRAHKAQIEFLADHKTTYVEIIRTSIRNGWTGLFPLKTGGTHEANRRADNSAPGRVRAANNLRR